MNGIPRLVPVTKAVEGMQVILKDEIYIVKSSETKLQGISLHFVHI